MRTFTTAAAVVALMTAVPAVAQQNQSSQPQAQQQQAQSSQQQKQGQMSQQDQKFAKEAATGNMMEVQLGELAQKQAQNEQVKQFGERMAQEHGKAQDKLKQILQQAKVEVPQQLPQDAQQKVDRLKQQQGKQFDQAYMELMVKDHEKDLQAYRQYTDQGEFQELVTYANQTTPILEQHYQQAQDVAKQVGAQVQASSGKSQQQGQKSQQQAMANDPGTEVVVDQGSTDVGVQQPAPNVTVVDPEPQVKVQTPEPQVSVDMPKPEVEIDQAKPDVNIQKQGQADVTIVERDTQQTRQTEQQGQQQAQRDDERTVEPGTDTTALDIQQEEIERQRERTAQQTGQQQTAQMGQGANLQDLVGSAVYGETGEQVGEISDVLMNQQGQAERVVIDRGGFLGIGEKTIAVDMDDLTVAQDRVQVNMTDQQISELPEWEGPGN